MPAPRWLHRRGAQRSRAGRGRGRSRNLADGDARHSLPVPLATGHSTGPRSKVRENAGAQASEGAWGQMPTPAASFREEGPGPAPSGAEVGVGRVGSQLLFLVKWDRSLGGGSHLPERAPSPPRQAFAPEQAAGAAPTPELAAHVTGLPSESFPPKNQSWASEPAFWTSWCSALATQRDVVTSDRRLRVLLSWPPTSCYRSQVHLPVSWAGTPRTHLSFAPRRPPWSQEAFWGQCLPLPRCGQTFTATFQNREVGQTEVARGAGWGGASVIALPETRFRRFSGRACPAHDDTTVGTASLSCRWPKRSATALLRGHSAPRLRGLRRGVSQRWSRCAPPRGPSAADPGLAARGVWSGFFLGPMLPPPPSPAAGSSLPLSTS